MCHGNLAKIGVWGMGYIWMITTRSDLFMWFSTTTPNCVGCMMYLPLSACLAACAWQHAMGSVHMTGSTLYDGLLIVYSSIYTVHIQI